jgi:mono/diheme cytochrome c family protein
MRVRRVAAALAAPLLIAQAAQAAPEGVALFAQHCAVCHQADGAGAAGVAPALTGEHWARLGADRNYLPTIVLHGLYGPIKLGGATTFTGVMPGLAAALDDSAVAAVANHVRKFQGAENGPPYSADEVKALRQLPGSPSLSRQKRSQLIGG